MGRNKLKSVTYSNQRLPEKYYQRRRLAAVVIVLVVVALLVWGLSAIARGGGDDGEKNAAPASSSTSATPAESTEAASSEAESSEAAESTAEEKPSEEKSEEKSEEPKPEDKTSCTLADLDIIADSDRANYPADAKPTFYMTVSNPTGADCEIDLDENSLRFEVYDLATNERIWSDTDCFDSVQTGKETFKAGEERFFEAVWSRTGSAPGKCDDRPEAKAGGYFLHTVIGDNPSPAHTFNLR